MIERAPGSATLLDVAREAGVSLSTASRALNRGSRQVRADLAARVLAAAETLNYSTNAQAQAVARGRSNTIGLIVSDISDPYFSSIAAGAIRAAEEHQLVVMMACTFRSPERELEYVTMLRSQRACGAILAGSRIADSTLNDRLAAELEAFQQAGGRVAAISQNKLSVDTVLIENRAAARDLAEALCEAGHRRFAVLAGPPDLVTARDRLSGFRQGLVRRGVPLPGDHVVHGDFTRNGGYAAAREVIRRRLDVTCIFAVNDVMAVGGMAALRDRGLEPPAGIAIAGFDDIEALRDVTPALSTVRLPLEDLGALAVDLVQQPPSDKPRVRRVHGEVVLRASTPQRRAHVSSPG
jgi:LacI family transcriptional regulator